MFQKKKFKNQAKTTKEGEMRGTYWSHDVEHRLTRDMREVCNMKIIMINIHTYDERWIQDRSNAIERTFSWFHNTFYIVFVQTNYEWKNKSHNQCQKQKKQIYEENKIVWQTICILFHHVCLSAKPAESVRKIDDKSIFKVQKSLCARLSVYVVVVVRSRLWGKPTFRWCEHVFNFVSRFEFLLQNKLKLTYTPSEQSEKMMHETIPETNRHIGK